MLVFTSEANGHFVAKSSLHDQGGYPLVWVIDRRKDGTHTIEGSDFALLNYVGPELISTFAEAGRACSEADARAEIVRNNSHNRIDKANSCR